MFLISFLVFMVRKKAELIHTIYKYWPDGTAKWLLGSDIDQSSELIPNGIIDKSNIFVVGDSYSKTTGWVIGCIDSVDVAYPLLKKSINNN